MYRARAILLTISTRMNFAASASVSTLRGLWRGVSGRLPDLGVWSYEGHHAFDGVATAQRPKYVIGLGGYDASNLRAMTTRMISFVPSRI